MDPAAPPAAPAITFDETVVPYAMLAFCKDGDDVFYHAANTQLGDEPPGMYWGEGYGSAMVTYDLKAGKREDRGVLVAEDNRLVMTPTAATCARRSGACS